MSPAASKDESLVFITCPFYFFGLCHRTALPNPDQEFSTSSILKFRSDLLEIASDRYHNKESDFFPDSWELGTAAEAPLKLSWPALSIFNATVFSSPRMADAFSIGVVHANKYFQLLDSRFLLLMDIFQDSLQKSKSFLESSCQSRFWGRSCECVS